MSLPRYPEYKDSGVEWVGCVPDHWEVRRFKWLIERNDGGVWGEEPDGNDDTIVLRSTEQTVDGRWRIDDPATRKLTQTERLSALLEVGDLLLTKSSGSALHIGKTTLVDEDVAGLGACYSNFMQRIRVTNQLRPKIAWYILNNGIARVPLDLLSNSTTGLANLNGTIIGELLLALAPREEQTAIAAFLDRETAKIDALVAEQEKLIALLAEKRQATISHAVTRGLNPNAPMKDSGVAWLGDVPAHWDSKRIKHIKAPVPNAFVDGPFGSNLKSEHFIDDGDVFVIESNFATQNKIDERELKTISFAHFETVSRSEVVAEDIVIAKIGAQFGKASILPTLSKRSVVSGNSLKLTVNAATCAVGWIHLQLVNLKAVGEIDLLANGSAQPALSLGGMNTLPIVLPPLPEQTDLLAFVALETTKLGALQSEAEKAIVLLKERRSALIAAAVTGQIDVRGVANA